MIIDPEAGSWDLKNENIVEKNRPNSVELVEEGKYITKEEITDKFKDRKVFVCDAYVKDIESHKDGLIFRDGNLYCVDHHAPLREYQTNISSTNIAIQYVKENGPVEKDFVVVVNHTDADSVLSSLILKGILPPDEKFAQAAIAADHTGEENEIADLLQAIQYERDIDLCVRNLQLFLDGKPIEEKAQAFLEKRKSERIKAKEMLNNGEIKNVGDVFYVELEKKIDPNFFVGMLPEAMIFVTFSKLEKDPNKIEARIRLGQKGLDGRISLLELGISEIDENWRGRWNAGSNKRGGGTDIQPEEYIKRLNDVLKKHFKK